MKSSINYKLLTFCVAVLTFTACKKDIDKIGILNTANYGNDGTPLKDAADFPIGVALNYNAMTSEPRYLEAVKRDFDGVVMEYHMKHGAVVRNDGTYDFGPADAMIAQIGDMEVFGHVLGWHQNQNATYLKNYAGIVQAAAAELYNNNPGFESGMSGWSIFNSNGATISATNIPAEVRTGSGAMKVVNPTAFPGSQWRVQVSSSAFPTEVGKQYVISYWVRTSAGNGSIRLSTGPTDAQYQGDQTFDDTWKNITYQFTANITSTTFLFDMGQMAGTYLIDDVSVKEVVPAPDQSQIAAKLDIALNEWITAMVNKYKSRVHAWDVVNELLTDDGIIRTNANTVNTAADVLVWSNYLGRDYAFKAFKYAEAADPSADLYINDYNLEVAPAKLDSTIKMVAELKARGAKVDGIGTQMHISRSTNQAGIINMFQKLAATGLKIRVSELDVKTVLTSAAGARTPQLDAFQAEMYRFVAESYIKYIPASQRAGFYIWGLNDGNSWLSNGGREFTLLYDDNYGKKPSYGGLLQGLQTR